MRHLRGLKDERGQSAVEFAVVLPLLVTVLFAMIQGGIALNHYLTLTDAVRVGARAASATAGQGGGAATTAAQQAMTNAADGMSLQGVQVASSWQPGSAVTVTAGVPYSITLLGVTVASGTFISKTTERVE